MLVFLSVLWDWGAIMFQLSGCCRRFQCGQGARVGVNAAGLIPYWFSARDSNFEVRASQFIRELQVERQRLASGIQGNPCIHPATSGSAEMSNDSNKVLRHNLGHGGYACGRACKTLQQKAQTGIETAP